MASMKIAPERFLRRSVSAASPLLLWAAHFFYCYVVVTVGCTTRGDAAALLAPPTLRWALLLGSALAAVAASWLVARSCMQVRSGEPGMALRVRLATGVLALIGIVWTTLPVLVLPLCIRP
jgi:hypothetical protein